MPPVFAFTDYKNRVLSAFYAIIMNKNSHAFLERKVRQRTSSRTHQFIFAKLLRFQRTFHEKSFVSGFGADSPTDNAYKNMLELRSKPPSLTFLIRKVSKRISHRLHQFILAKLLKFQETFPEKFLVSGSHGRSSNIQYTQKNKMFPDKKSENTLLFIFLGENLCERPAG